MSGDNTARITIDDCWNRSGVWGQETPRCPELERVIHCRNCEHFSAAGRQMLNRGLPEGYLAEWAGVYAQDKSTKTSGEESALIFRLGDEWFALPTVLIEEITQIQPVHRLPHYDARTVKGVVNIRGELKICVCLGSLLGLEKGTFKESRDNGRAYERLMVIHKEGRQFVFPVSEVYGTARYHPNDLQTIPSTVSKAKSSFTTGILNWKDKHVACLEDELLFYAMERSLS